MNAIWAGRGLPGLLCSRSWGEEGGNGGVRGGERGEWSWGLGPVKYDESYPLPLNCNHYIIVKPWLYLKNISSETLTNDDNLF